MFCECRGDVLIDLLNKVLVPKEDVQNHIRNDLAAAEMIFENSRIPLTLRIFCLNEVPLRERRENGLGYFHDLEDLRNGAENAIGKKNVHLTIRVSTDKRSSFF